MKPVVLVNVSAGTAAEYEGDTLDRVLGRELAEVGVAAEVKAVAPGDLDAALKRARGGDRPVVVAGGDGTVAAAVQLLAGTSVPLGVLPLGTYNLLGRDLGMSSDLREAVRQLASAEIRPIDLGLVEGKRYFHTLAGFGYFSRVARARQVARESLPGSRIVQAALAVFRSLTRGGSLDVRVRAGNRVETVRTPAILVTNNLLNHESWRRERLDGGMFEINIVRGDVPFPLVKGGLAALMGSWRDSSDIMSFTASEFSLEFRRPRIFVNLDGEHLRPRTPVRFKMVPRSLHVMAARPAVGESETAPLP